MEKLPEFPMPETRVEKKADEYKDDIHTPAHYHKGGIDVIEYAEQKFSKEELKGFYRINILKYVTRYDEKGTPLSDLGKADFYLQKLKELEAESDEL